MSAAVLSQSEQPPVEPGATDQPQMQWVTTSRIRTGLQGLRGTGKPQPSGTQELRPLPLRVVPTDDGEYELLDGFKRFGRWLQLDLKQVPVVMECPRSSVDQKVSLLEANRPPRTLSPMDEARVVWDLRHHEKLGSATIAKACGRKRRWVLQRLTLAEQLCEPLQKQLDEGAFGVTSPWPTPCACSRTRSSRRSPVPSNKTDSRDRKRCRC